MLDKKEKFIISCAEALFYRKIPENRWKYEKLAEKGIAFSYFPWVMSMYNPHVVRLLMR